MPHTPATDEATNNYGSNPSNPNIKLIVGLLIAALVISWGYIIYDKSQTKEYTQRTEMQLLNKDSSLSAVRLVYNNALSRLDSISTLNVKLDNNLISKRNEIEKLKHKIKSLLASNTADLEKARHMVDDFNSQIANLSSTIDKLKEENKYLAAHNEELSTEKQKLSTEKQQLQENLAASEQEKKVLQEEGSTLHATNISITPIQLKGTEEKETTNPKKATIFKIAFNIAENKIAASGVKDFYIVVSNPQNKIIVNPSSSNTFTTKTEGELNFTNKIEINYQQGKAMPVSFNWKPNTKFEEGVYTIRIYQNGYKIGEAIKKLKKTGLFG